MNPLDLINARLEHIHNEIMQCVEELKQNNQDSIENKVLYAFASRYIEHLQDERKVLMNITRSITTSITEKIYN